MLPEHSKAALFADPYTPVATTMDIKAYYDAKNGAPTADTKVFLYWFYAKTVTDEKSDEMMGYAQLAE